MRGMKYELVMVGLLSLGINVLMLSPSLYMLQVYDRVMISHNELTLLFSTLLLVLVLSVVAWFEQWRTRLLVDLGIAFDHSLQADIFHTSLKTELGKTSANPLQTVYDLAQVRQFITSQGLFALFDAPWFFVYAFILFLMHPLLGFVGLFFAAIHIGFIFHSKKVAAPAIEKTSARTSNPTKPATQQRIDSSTRDVGFASEKMGSCLPRLAIGSPSI
jgi:ATP-binding cassette, subfamily C, bacterial exporter for protease/lipase